MWVLLIEDFELVRHSNAVTAIGEVFKQNMIFKGWVKITTKYSDADECMLWKCSSKWGFWIYVLNGWGILMQFLHLVRFLNRMKIFEGWVKIVTKYSDGDECQFCGDTVLELQYALADWSKKWLNKDRYQSLWGFFVSVFGQHFGLSIGEAFEQDKMQLVWYLTAFFFGECKWTVVFKLLGIGNQQF